MPRHPVRFHAAVLGLALLAAACGGESGQAGGAANAGAGDSTSAPDTTAGHPTVAAPPEPVPLANAVFRAPESVLWDSTADVYFVSNINGDARAEDGNGFISRVRPDGSVDSLHFVQGGRGGATLNAPKGMAIIGNTLWVADLDRIRAFDKRTGRPVGGIDLAKAGASFLNDLTPGPKGSLYISDTDGNRVFNISRNLQPSSPVTGDTLQGPNGLFWEEDAGRLVIASMQGTSVFGWSPADSTLKVLARGVGGFDGVARLGDGRLVVSSLTNGGIYVLTKGGLTRLSDQKGVADLGADTKRGRLLLPILGEDRVVFLDVPK